MPTKEIKPGKGYLRRLGKRWLTISQYIVKEIVWLKSTQITIALRSRILRRGGMAATLQTDRRFYSPDYELRAAN